MLKLENIQKRFKQKIVLKDISLTFESGKIYGLLGNNGAGKTTLVKIIFQEYKFDGGTIKYNNQEIKEINYKDWYFFSENNELPKNIKVGNYINMIRNMTLLPKDVFKTRISEINQFLDVRPWLKNKIGSLSAGQQKLLSLYVCLLLKPKIIFFDEPTANVDFANKEIILEVIKKLKNEETLIVVITHLIEEIKVLLDHVIIIDDGLIKYNQEFSNKKENLKAIFEKNAAMLINNKQDYLEAYINENPKSKV